MTGVDQMIEIGGYCIRRARKGACLVTVLLLVNLHTLSQVACPPSIRDDGSACL